MSFDQSLTHRLHAPAHMPKISKPLRRQLLVFKDFRDNPGTIDWRSRDLCPRKPREHGKSPRLSGFCSTNYMQSTHALDTKDPAILWRPCRRCIWSVVVFDASTRTTESRARPMSLLVRSVDTAGGLGGRQRVEGRCLQDRWVCAQLPRAPHC